MKRSAPLYQRLTHKYAEGWASELDRWHYIGDAGILKYGKPVYLDKYGESWNTVIRVKLSYLAHDATEEQAMDAMRTLFNRACRCEHDCCGHVQSYGTTVRKDKRREYLVRVHSYVNV